MKSTKLINKLIFYPLLSVVIISLLGYAELIDVTNPNGELAFKLISIILIVISVVFAIIKFILDKKSREKVFVTSLSAEVCREKCKSLDRGKLKVKKRIVFESEENGEIFLKALVPGYSQYPYPPDVIGLKFQQDGDRTIIRCKVKGLSTSNTIGFCFFGVFLCILLFLLIVEAFAGIDMYSIEYFYLLLGCVVITTLFAVCYGGVFSTWKGFEKILDSMFQATEVEDDKQ